MPWRPLWSGPPILQQFSCLVRHFSFRWYSALVQPTLSISLLWLSLDQQSIQILRSHCPDSSDWSTLLFFYLYSQSPVRFSSICPSRSLNIPMFSWYSHMLYSWYSSPVFFRYTLARLYYGSAVSRAFIVSSYSPSRSHDHEQSILLFFLLFCALLYSEHPCSPILIAITTIIIK